MEKNTQTTSGDAECEEVVEEKLEEVEQEPEPTDQELEEFNDYLMNAKEYIDVPMADFIAQCTEVVKSRKKLQEVKMLLLSCKAYFVNYRAMVKEYLGTALDPFVDMTNPDAMMEESKNRQVQFDNLINSEIVITRVEERFAVLEVMEQNQSRLLNAQQ